MNRRWKSPRMVATVAALSIGVGGLFAGQHASAATSARSVESKTVAVADGVSAGAGAAATKRYVINVYPRNGKTVRQTISWANRSSLVIVAVPTSRNSARVSITPTSSTVGRTTYNRTTYSVGELSVQKIMGKPADTYAEDIITRKTTYWDLSRSGAVAIEIDAKFRANSRGDGLRTSSLYSIAVNLK